MIKNWTVLYSIPLLLLLLSGCATNLSTLQTADTVSAPGVRIAGGAGVYIPGSAMLREMDPRACASSLQADGASGAIACVSDEYVEILESVQSGDMPPLDINDPDDRETIRRMFSNAVGLALFPPAPMAELSVRAGLASNVDIGFRLTPLSGRGDLKIRIMNREALGTGVSIAVMAGIEYYAYNWFLMDFEEYLRKEYKLFHHIVLDNPQRIDADIALIASGKLLKVFYPYASLKYRAGIFAVPLELSLEHPEYDTVTVRDDIRGSVHFGGVTAGMAMGMHTFRLFAEITAVMSVSDVEVLDETIELGGPTFYPALGLAIEIP